MLSSYAMSWHTISTLIIIRCYCRPNPQWVCSHLISGRTPSLLSFAYSAWSSIARVREDVHTFFFLFLVPSGDWSRDVHFEACCCSCCCCCCCCCCWFDRRYGGIADVPDCCHALADAAIWYILVKLSINRSPASYNKAIMIITVVVIDTSYVRVIAPALWLARPPSRDSGPMAPTYWQQCTQRRPLRTGHRFRCSCWWYLTARRAWHPRRNRPLQPSPSVATGCRGSRGRQAKCHPQR